jgi:hypothetical protein
MVEAGSGLSIELVVEISLTGGYSKEVDLKGTVEVFEIRVSRGLETGTW